MKESLSASIEVEPSSIKKLMDFFPAGSVEEISRSNLPTEILKHFEKNSEKFISPEDYKPGNFQTLFTLTRSPDTKTYGAIQLKNFDTDQGEDVDESVYLMDTERGEVTGYSHIRCNLVAGAKPVSTKIPFVDFTRTYENFSGRNLGTSRLYTMNNISMALYKTPLTSGAIRVEGIPDIIWGRLVEKGEVEKFKEGKVDRYRFLSK